MAALSEVDAGGGEGVRQDETRTTPAVARRRRLRLLLKLLREPEAADRPPRLAAVNELIGLQLESVRGRAAWRLRAPSVSREEVEIVVSMALARLASALANMHSVREVSLIALVNSCVDLAAVNFVRECIRRRRYEQITDPELMPEPELDDASALEHAQAAVGALAGLTARELRIVGERALLDLTPDEIAARHQITRGAVYVAYSRALTKLRKRAEVGDREPWASCNDTRHCAVCQVRRPEPIASVAQ